MLAARGIGHGSHPSEIGLITKSDRIDHDVLPSRIIGRKNGFSATILDAIR